MLMVPTATEWTWMGLRVYRPICDLACFQPARRLQEHEKRTNRAPDAQSAAGCQAWINELIWREFYQSILFHFPFVSNRAFQARYRNLVWRTAPEDLQAWQEGTNRLPDR